MIEVPIWARNVKSPGSPFYAVMSTESGWVRTKKFSAIAEAEAACEQSLKADAVEVYIFNGLGVAVRRLERPKGA